MLYGPTMPLVHVVVRDQDAWLVVDTGSNAFAITPLLAATLGLDMRGPTTPLHASSGENVPVPRAPGVPGIFDNGTPFALDPLIVATLPPPVMRAGIAGILSPQRLAASDRDVLIDFPAAEMTVGPVGMFRTVRTPAEEIPAVKGATVCGPAALSRYTVPVSILGQTWRFLLDTGANQTNIVSGSALAPLLSLQPTQASSQGVASTIVSAKGTATVDISVGDARKTLLALVVNATPSCGVDGYLGFDFLRACRIVLTHSGVGLSCPLSRH